MGRGKDLFIDRTGGYFADETIEERKVRLARIAELEAHPTLAGFEELKRLKRLPPDEWDYDPNDD